MDVVPAFRVNEVPLTPVTPSLKVAVRLPVWLAPVAPTPRNMAVTVGLRRW